jgi:HEAT repeat protein
MRILLIALLANLLFCFSAGAEEKRPVKYQGHPVEYWVEKLRKADSVKDYEEASQAIRAFGPEAIAALPLVLDLLEDRSFDFRQMGWRMLDSMGESASKDALPRLIYLLEKDGYEDDDQVAGMFATYGNLAKAAVPAITKKLDKESGPIPYFFPL